LVSSFASIREELENDERATEDPSSDNFYSKPTFKMGRLHSKGKGISSSAIPYSRAPPAWLKTTPEQVVDQICKLARKGATPSQIGVVLRDSHGVAQVKVVTGTFILSHLEPASKRLTHDIGNKILRILKSNGTVHPV
jgi:hypothetical protein